MFAQTYLSLLDGLSGSLFKQLDGLVVVQCAAASDHVTKVLNTVELTIRVLRSRVIHEADLEKDLSCSETIERTTRRQKL